MKEIIVATLLVLECGCAYGALFSLVGKNPGSLYIQVNGVTAGMFNSSKMSTWHYDKRRALIEPNSGGSCNGNIYNPSVVNNGGETWNVYFGGWDGVDSCHDAVSISVTTDRFATVGAHYPMIATGVPDVVHVNNPSTIKFDTESSGEEWLMVYTELVAATNLNKPGISSGATGIDWSPDSGGVASAFVNMTGYAGWDQADVNGGNVLVHEESSGKVHLFFIDFKAEASHSVFHAVCESKDALPNFVYANVALEEPSKVVNDVKLVNGHYLMGLHMNSDQTWFSVSDDLDATFPQAQTLFHHMDEEDAYIVSVGFVTDSSSSSVLGALYGASSVPTLDQNRIFAAWLQRQVLFYGVGGEVWGLGDASMGLGPDTLLLASNQDSLEGQFRVYDSDFVDTTQPGTFLAESDVVTVHQGDIWQLTLP